MEDISFSGIKEKNIETESNKDSLNSLDEVYNRDMDSIRDELIKRYGDTITELVQVKSEQNIKSIQSYLEIVLLEFPKYNTDI